MNRLFSMVNRFMLNSTGAAEEMSSTPAEREAARERSREMFERIEQGGGFNTWSQQALAA